MWPFRIWLAKLRPLNSAGMARLVLVTLIFGGFLYGDFVLSERLFRAVKDIEAATPFFAIGLLRNLLALVFLIATVVLFSSAMTAAIGAFFTDLDLDLLHAAPRTELRVAWTRWGKTLAESAAVVFAFLVPVLLAFAQRYGLDGWFLLSVTAHLFLMLTIPVSAASTLILLLVRWFPVRRVHQIVATLAIIVLTLVVVAFRMSRPERLFTEIRTDNLVTVLRAVELPSMDVYPGTAVADLMADAASRRQGSSGEAGLNRLPIVRIGVPATALLVLFLLAARGSYFRAWVRARESMAPVALGSALATTAIDRALSRFDVQTRALVAKEVRLLARDVAQWSQLFLMAALLFVYLYNIRILPLGGDVRATVVAYANLGMTGFIIAAICMRFAYPSVSAEGKSVWLVQSAPISYRRLLLVKVAVFAAPLTIVSIVLTILANLILDSGVTIWIFTLAGASILAVTLVSLGVAMGAFSPDFAAENPLQVGLSLGGFAYMAVSLAYVAAMMILMARPVMRFAMRRLLGFAEQTEAFTAALPVVIAVTVSAALIVFPLVVAERRLARRI